MIATVLLATAISVTATRNPTPTLAVLGPIINFWICSISHWTPPALVVIVASPPVSKDNKKISFIPINPLYISFENVKKVKSPYIKPITPDKIIPDVNTTKTFIPTIANTRTAR